MTVTSLPFSSRTWRSSASAYLRPSWKMWPISMPRADSSVPTSQLGQGSPSRTSAASMVPSGVKSRPTTRSMTWLPSTSAPVTQRVPWDDPGVDEVADPGRALLAERAGADVALDQRGVLRELRLVERLDLGRLELALEPLLVDLAVAGQADGQRLAGAVGVLEHDQDVLEGVGGRPGPVVARERGVEVVDQRLDGRGVGRVLRVRGGRVVVRAPGRAAAPGPPRRWRRSRSSCSGRRCPRRPRRWPGTPPSLRAAHGAGGRLDDDVVEPEPVEDPDVGVAVRLVARVEPGVVDVEGVGVLHDELAAAQQAGARPRLVAVLRLDLVDRERQVLVGRVEVLHDEREHLLVRGAEQVVAALAVLEPEDAVAVLGPAAGRLVGLARQQRGEVQLLGADARPSPRG